MTDRFRKSGGKSPERNRKIRKSDSGQRYDECGEIARALALACCASFSVRAVKPEASEKRAAAWS
eukprot:2668052-Pleurochrysis_carterae.AAC.1